MSLNSSHRYFQNIPQTRLASSSRAARRDNLRLILWGHFLDSSITNDDPSMHYHHLIPHFHFLWPKRWKRPPEPSTLYKAQYTHEMTKKIHSFKVNYLRLSLRMRFFHSPTKWWRQILLFEQFCCTAENFVCNQCRCSCNLHTKTWYSALVQAGKNFSRDNGRNWAGAHFIFPAWE